MRKIIFLDFDGPIATSTSYRAVELGSNGLVSAEYMERYLDPVLVGRVEAICQSTDAKIVLSTSWVSMCGTDKCTEMLKAKGLGDTRIIGATPRKMSNYFRGNEIQWWLDDNKDVRISDYIILDDDRDFHLGQMQRWIDTPFDIGITDEQVALAIEMLGDLWMIKT